MGSPIVEVLNCDPRPRQDMLPHANNCALGKSKNPLNSNFPNMSTGKTA